MKYTCPCCGYRVFESPPGSYVGCPICFWEDDDVQLAEFTLPGGANRPSLVQAQENFARYGACEERFIKSVRQPTVDELRDPQWRPVNIDTDQIRNTLYPNDRTELYYWN